MYLSRFIPRVELHLPVVWLYGNIDLSIFNLRELFITRRVEKLVFSGTLRIFRFKFGNNEILLTRLLK